MFVALELISPQKQGVWGKVVRLLRRPKTTLEQVDALGVRYGVLRAVVREDGGLDWPLVEELAGRFANRLLLPDHLELPPDSLLGALSCPEFQKKTLVATACHIIQQTRMPLYRRVLGLIDLDGSCADLLFPLLQQYCTVHVVTHRPDIYHAAAGDMMEQLGAPVLVGDQLTLLSQCVLVLATGDVPDQTTPLPCPVLEGSPPPTQRQWDVITDLRVSPPQEVASLCPPGISPHRFAAALFEYCGLPTEDFAAAQVVYNHAAVPISYIIDLVRHRSQDCVEL